MVLVHFRKSNVLAALLAALLLIFIYARAILPRVDATFGQEKRSSSMVSLDRDREIEYAAPLSEGAEENKASRGTYTDINGAVIHNMLSAAKSHPRKRKMFDMTINPRQNNLQSMINVWTEVCQHFKISFRVIIISCIRRHVF